MTPHQRRLYDVRSAIRFMRLEDLHQAAGDATLPKWARDEYRQAAERLEAEAAQ